MATLSCILVDDEPISLALLQHFVSQVPQLKIKGVFENGSSALRAFEEDNVDVLFLDINMDHMSGLEVAQAIDGRAHIVFTTASREYGPEAFALHAIDYLVKPFTEERFLQTIARLQKQMELTQPVVPVATQFLLVRDVRKLVRLAIEEVLVVEALGDYLKIHTNQCFYTMLGTMKQMEKKLVSVGFIRVHRSFLVATSHIQSMLQNQLIIGSHKIPVSDTFKRALKAQLKSNAN